MRTRTLIIYNEKIHTIRVNRFIRCKKIHIHTIAKCSSSSRKSKEKENANREEKSKKRTKITCNDQTDAPDVYNYLCIAEREHIHSVCCVHSSAFSCRLLVLLPLLLMPMLMQFALSCSSFRSNNFIAFSDSSAIYHRGELVLKKWKNKTHWTNAFSKIAHLPHNKREKKSDKRKERGRIMIRPINEKLYRNACKRKWQSFLSYINWNIE